MKSHGFTLIELVTVILILGIVSAIALPRFFNNDSFTSFFDRSEFESALNWTRNRAVTSKCAHEFRIDSSGWFVLRDDDGDNDLAEDDCSSMSDIGNGCDALADEYFSFAYSSAADIVNDGSATPLSGTEITSASLQRLIFTADGKLYQLTSAPSPLANGCTALPTSPISNGTTINLTGVTLTVDGATAYVAVQ